MEILHHPNLDFESFDWREMTAFRAFTSPFLRTNDITTYGIHFEEKSFQQRWIEFELTTEGSKLPACPFMAIGSTA